MSNRALVTRRRRSPRSITTHAFVLLAAAADERAFGYTWACSRSPIPRSPRIAICATAPGPIAGRRAKGIHLEIGRQPATNQSPYSGTIMVNADDRLRRIACRPYRKAAQVLNTELREVLRRVEIDNPRKKQWGTREGGAAPEKGGTHRHPASGTSSMYCRRCHGRAAS